MLMKKLAAVFLVSSVILSGLFFTAPQDVKACEHYFMTEYRGGQKCLVEYDCDGSVVNVTVLED